MAQNSIWLAHKYSKYISTAGTFSLIYTVNLKVHMLALNKAFCTLRHLQLSVNPSVWMEEPVLSLTYVPVPVVSLAPSVKLVSLWWIHTMINTMRNYSQIFPAICTDWLSFLLKLAKAWGCFLFETAKLTGIHLLNCRNLCRFVSLLCTLQVMLMASTSNLQTGVRTVQSVRSFKSMISIFLLIFQTAAYIFYTFRTPTGKMLPHSRK